MRKIDIFSGLRIADAVGAPLFKDAASGWMFNAARAVFDTDKNGRRVFLEHFILIPKKNGKSLFAAGVMLTELLANTRAGAEFLILSATKDMADNTFRAVCDMVDAGGDLNTFLTVKRSTREIVHESTGARLLVLSARSVTGTRARGVLIDELHEFDKLPNARDVINEATGGAGVGGDGFIIYITTQSDTKPAGVFLDKLTHARRVAAGDVLPNGFNSILYEFTPEQIKSGAAFDPKNWGKVCPNLGRSITLDFLVRMHEQAQAAGGDAYRAFCSKYLNIQIDEAAAVSDFFQAEKITDEIKQTAGEFVKGRARVFAGIDGGGLFDFIGVTLLAENAAGGLDIWQAAGCFSGALKSTAGRFDEYTNGGGLSVFVDGDKQAAGGFVVDILQTAKDAGVLVCAGGDVFGTINAKDAAAAAGVEFVDVPQGFRLGGVFNRLAVLIAGGNCRAYHGGGLLRDCIKNARAVVGVSAVEFEKSSPGAKIDPLLSLAAGVYCMERSEQAGGVGVGVFNLPVI